MAEWDGFATTYVNSFSLHFNVIYHRITTLLSQHLSSLPLDESLQLLDYGCGHGEPLLTVAEWVKESHRKGHIKGVDFAQNLLKIGEERWNTRFGICLLCVVL
jgi:ubiquinone/menaquinone biosynthesis C-methylase UbiE